MPVKLTAYNIMLLLILALLLVFVYQNINQDQALIKIGIVDSGCSLSQSEYVVEYTNYANISYGFPSNDLSKYDTLNHGENICQIIIDNTEEVELYSAKIAHSTGVLTFKALFAAIEWLVEEKNVNVINLSLGSSGILNDELIHGLDKYMNKTIFVAASGNTGSNDYNTNGRADWPAILPFVIGVGSFENNESQPAYYSASGRAFNGIYSTSFSSFGSYNGIRGTSISTPYITARLVSLMQDLDDNDIIYELDDLMSILATLTSDEKFDPVLGWGDPTGIIKPIISNSIMIEGIDEIDEFRRFNDEEWDIKWKYHTFDPEGEIKGFDMTFSGNGSDAIQRHSVEDQAWGSILSLKFNPKNMDEGRYTVFVNNNLGNSVSYSFNLFNQSEGKILFDHRTSINSYGHSYGEFSTAEGLFRSYGYTVDHLFFDEPVALEQYKLVIAPRFLQKETVVSETFEKIFDNQIFEDYMTYIQSGGIFMPLTDIDDNTRVEELNDFLIPLGVNYTLKRIHNNFFPVSVSNFTENSLTEGIVNFDFVGQEIVNTGINTEIAWVKMIETNLFETYFDYRSIGVLGSYGIGKFLILGSTYPLTNDYLQTISLVHFDKLLINLISI